MYSDQSTGGLFCILLENKMVDGLHDGRMYVMYVHFGNFSQLGGGRCH